MHAEAMEFGQRIVEATGIAEATTVVDLGGRNVNGSYRDLFTNPAVIYDAVDQWPGEGVTYVADAAVWRPDRSYDVGISTEVFEHAERWRWILGTLARSIRPGGIVLVTCGTDPRRPHSAIDGHYLEPSEEFYANVKPEDLWETMSPNFVGLRMEVRLLGREPGDLYAVGYREVAPEALGYEPGFYVDGVYRGESP